MPILSCFGRKEMQFGGEKVLDFAIPTGEYGPRLPRRDNRKKRASPLQGWVGLQILVSACWLKATRTD